MSSVAAKPLRRVRHEIFALSLVAAVPLAIVFAFPLDAFSFRARQKGDDVRPSCAFVTLTDEEERAALSTARTSWQVDARGVKHMRVDISTSDLPPAPVRPVIATRPPRRAAIEVPEYVPDALPPTVAAPAAVQMKAEADASPSAKAAFSREELLKID